MFTTHSSTPPAWPDPRLGHHDGYARQVNLGAPQLLIVLVVVLLLFGSTKLPKLARSLGQAQKEFKTGLNEGHRLDEPGEHKPSV
jgi:sec-independent protein translocase protein TatA